MKNSWIPFLLLISSIQASSQTLTEKHISIDGRDRLYLLYTPSGLDNSKRYPLVIVLHGGGGNAKRMVEFSGFDHLAEKEKFLVLYPNGYKKGWNDGRVARDVKANAENVDDVKFIKAALEEVSLASGIDPKKVFVTGISNGAMMSIYLAYHMSDKVRAIAPVSGSIPENLSGDFKLANPVSILVINGTADNLVPFEGGPILGKRADRGSVISTLQMMTIWQSFTNQSAKPREQPMPDIDLSDRCSADRIIYSSATIMPVELIRVNNGGHTWPGGKQYLPRMIVGNVCRDFHAEDVIWDFFKRQEER